jgi:metal-responsive CopG/Arc/MetJ family transcriptional regulator
MKPIQILVGDALVREMDHEARRQRIDRSKLIRRAVEKYLAEMRRVTLEGQHRAGYLRHPQRKDEVAPWERIQQWPEE